MLADIQKTPKGYEVQFERHLPHPVEKVWRMLTENDELQKWFAELRVDELREGGLIKFDMGDGTFEEMKILEVKEQSVLEYTWGEDVVRFELKAKQNNAHTKLLLIEKITQMTEHTPKDLAGWHVCLDVIESLLDERELEAREEAWQPLYEQYRTKINNIE